MNIFYDSTIFSRQTIGGISHYMVELVNHLPDNVHPVLGVRASENVYLADLAKPRHHLSLRHFPEHRKIYKAINRYLDRRIMKRGDYDIIHPTDYNIEYLRYNTRPVVLTVHDLIHKRLSGWFRKEAIDDIDRCIVNADAIIAISKATKKDIIDYYGIDAGRITVVYHGYTPVAETVSAVAPVAERYILFVGKRGGYKNFDAALEAFAIVAKRDKDLQLVCTGRPFTTGERKQIASFGLTQRVVQHMFPTSMLAPLYANAQCFIFPSKLEGFGMPVLEAFAAGTPALLSNTSCLPEIGGEGAVYFDPDNPQEIADLVTRVIDDSVMRQGLIAAGRERLRDFSWEKAAMQTASVYASLLDNTSACGKSG